jgi:hypothetical protein
VAIDAALALALWLTEAVEAMAEAGAAGGLPLAVSLERHGERFRIAVEGARRVDLAAVRGLGLAERIARQLGGAQVARNVGDRGFALELRLDRATLTSRSPQPEQAGGDPV